MAALSQVKDPEIGKDLVSLGMVKTIEITGSTVDLTVELTTPACPLKAKIESDIVDGLAALGATTVKVDWASNVKRSFGGPAADLIPGVKNTIAVASGQGRRGQDARWRSTWPSASRATARESACSTPTSPARTCR